jgi:hypothetical protein
VALVRKRTIPTERPPLLVEVSAKLLRVEGVACWAQRIPTAVNLGFLGRSRYFFIQVAGTIGHSKWPQYHESHRTKFKKKKKKKKKKLRSDTLN